MSVSNRPTPTRTPAAGSGRRRRQRGPRTTPYSTSGRRKNTDAVPSADFDREFEPTSDQLEFMKDVVGKTWTLNHVSPLWHLSTSSSALTEHTQQLSSLFTQVPKVPAGLKISVTVVKRIGIDGSDALKITSSKSVKNKDVVVLEAYICQLRRACRTVEPGFTSLPLLLFRGPQTLTSQLQTWLQTSFDCHVSPLSLGAEDLSLLVGQFATAERSRRGLGGVQLVYKTPVAVAEKGLSTVSVSLTYSSVVSAWESAGDGQTERRKGFVNILEQHVKKQLGFEMQAMSLLRISTPVLHAEATGRIKFTSEEPIIPVLSVLQSVHF